MTEQETAAEISVQVISGVANCRGQTSFGELVRVAQLHGWCLDGINPEPQEATLSELLARRQRRPPIWQSGQLAASCVWLQGRFNDVSDYRSRAAPRQASGPDLRYLFIGAEERFGQINGVGMTLVRPTPHYIQFQRGFDTFEALALSLAQLALESPRSLRRASFELPAIDALIPVLPGVAPERLASVLGLSPDSWKIVTAPVPASAYFREPDPEHGLWVSSGFSVAQRVLLHLRSLFGDDEMRCEVEYSDAHGCAVVYGLSDGVTVERVLKELAQFPIDDSGSLAADPAPGRFTQRRASL